MRSQHPNAKIARSDFTLLSGSLHTGGISNQQWKMTMADGSIWQPWKAWHFLAPLSSGFLWLFRCQNRTSKFGEKSQNIFIWYQCTWLGIRIYCVSHQVFLPSTPITSAVQHPHSWTTQYDEMRRRDLGRKEKSPWLVLDAESTTIIIEGTKQLVYQKMQWNVKEKR